MQLPPDTRPPRSRPAAHRLVRAFAAPVERFLAVEAASGIVLLASAAVALLWANSHWASSYEALWTRPLGLEQGPLPFVRDLRWWVNDGLMTVFFFVVGLEIRRETHAGELSDLRRAALPLAAALGGMAVPALIYTAFNAGHATAGGWGVPMATDIAFAVGVLALLGDRVPPALRILLLALAVIDDLGAIVIIAVFYSHGLSLPALGLAGLSLFLIAGLLRAGLRSPLFFLPLGLLAWGATYAAGVHPTIAGVALGMLVPVAVAPGQAQSPLERLEHTLHGWVAWLVMPLFALANAGVALGSLRLEGEGWRVFVGIGLGLFLGKTLGVVGASRLAVALRLAALPRGVGWAEVSVVGIVAGIGFTMALFVAQLAFPPGPDLETAKLAILAASAVAGTAGLVLGRAVLRPGGREGAARTAAEAEASAEV